MSRGLALRIADSSILWRYWLPPLIWALAIMVVSGDLGSGKTTFSLLKWGLSLLVTLTPDRLNLAHFYFRKSLHVVCYGVLTFLWFRALMASCPGRFWTNVAMALALCLAVALVDEGHQYMVNTRTASWRDVGLDLSGGVIFLLLSASYFKKSMKAFAERGLLPPAI
jgi:VanZ family protein